MDELRSRIAHAFAWGTAALGGLSFNEVGIAVGMACSVITMAVNWYYAKKKAERGN